MAVTETPIKNACNLKLNNGTSASGLVQTVNVSLGTLSENWDAQKAMNVIEALSLCLSKSVYEAQHVLTTQLQD